MHTFQVFTYAYIVQQLQAGESVSPWFLYCDEWKQLGEYLPLETKNMVRLATPDVLPEPIADGELADWEFEDSRNHMYESGRLQR